MADMPDAARPETVVVSLPDIPERVHMGELAGDQIRRFATGKPLINEVARYLLK